MSRFLQLVAHLLTGAVDVRVVLGEATGPGHAVDDAGLLQPVHGAELEQPQRQFPVRPAARVEDQVVHRAVHRLQVVVLALLADLAVRPALLVQVHGRVHAVGVPVQVARGLEQLRLGDVRRVDELVPVLDVPLARVVLHHLAQHAALGVEDREAGADLVGEAEQVELGAQLAVVALGGLLKTGQVSLHGVAGVPRGAVDALQLRVLLAPPPVRRRNAHQLEVAQIPRGRNMRTATEVLPRHAVVTPDVVVDRQLAGADLDGCALGGVGRGGALDPDQFQLVRLVGQLCARVVVRDHPAAEPLPLLDDLLHLLLELGQILRGERGGHVEVVVEAVLDRRADAELGVREQVLDGLREDVRGRVPDDRQTLVGRRLHRLDLVAVGDHPGQVAQLPVDLGGDGGAVLTEDLGEQLPDGRRLGHAPLSLALDADQMDLDFRHVHSSGTPVRRARSVTPQMVSTPPRCPFGPSTGGPDPDESQG